MTHQRPGWASPRTGPARSAPARRWPGWRAWWPGGSVAILSGAGLSTESGIPDYRGPTGLARRAGTPMTYQAFTGSAAARQRYWARSHLGWGHIAGAEPNAGHRAVAELDRRGLLAGIITQNVDGLHQAAGAGQVIELHGSLDRVRCLGCGERTPRLDLDRRLRAANPAWAAGRPPRSTRTATWNWARTRSRTFQVVDCRGCGGLLMPDVVFFGENVPRPRVDTCFALVARSAALVVLGSSLTVMSGYRFVRHAARLGVPVAIVNQGATRGGRARRDHPRRRPSARRWPSSALAGVGPGFLIVGHRHLRRPGTGPGRLIAAVGCLGRTCAAAGGRRAGRAAAARAGWLNRTRRRPSGVGWLLAARGRRVTPRLGLATNVTASLAHALNCRESWFSTRDGAPISKAIV